MLERTQGTLVRLAAAPVRPAAIVNGKMLAVGATGLVSIFVVWGATAVVFGADWGAPLGVLLMCLGAVAAMCGFGVLVTSFARNEREAFAASLIVGLVLALLGGNLLPPGALPTFLQMLSLATPNGWALVGFGRLALLREPAGDILGPFLVLCFIAVLTDRAGPDPGAPHGDAVIPVVRVNVRRAVGDARLVFVATAFPVLFILVTGLLAGSPREPVGPGAPVAAAASSSSTAPTASRPTSRPAAPPWPTTFCAGAWWPAWSPCRRAPGHLRVEFVSEGANTSAVQARTDVVALLDLMTAEGTRTS